MLGKTKKITLTDYIKGIRKGKGAQKLETEAMKDPFLSEAMDGYRMKEDNRLPLIMWMRKEVRKRSKRRFTPFRRLFCRS
ncbi:hypothetical protein AGMMS49574_17260 [Bacteroidia bacterium]|nr:hypothetical protein AGMMS49574_17260 [Bacteroidia bacterium]